MVDIQPNGKGSWNVCIRWANNQEKNGFRILDIGEAWLYNSSWHDITVLDTRAGLHLVATHLGMLKSEKLRAFDYLLNFYNTQHPDLTINSDERRCLLSIPIGGFRRHPNFMDCLYSPKNITMIYGRRGEKYIKFKEGCKYGYYPFDEYNNLQVRSNLFIII